MEGRIVPKRIILDCNECPHFDLGYCENDGYRDIPIKGEIPEWCPLEKIGE